MTIPTLRFPEGDIFILLRRSFVTICAGNVTAAAMLHYFEQWHYVKVAARENHLQNRSIRDSAPSLWQYHSNKHLEDALMGIGKRHSIDNAKQLLLNLGIIEIHRQPPSSNPIECITHYLFHPEVVQQLLERTSTTNEEKGYAENSRGGMLKTAGGYAENSSIIYPTENPGHKEESPAPSGGEVVKPGNGKKEKPPPRPHWQLLIDTWYQLYKGWYGGEEPTVAGRNLTLFGTLYDRIRKRAEARGKEWTAENATEALRYFLTLAHGEEWLSAHFLLTNLVEQFDAVYAREAMKAAATKPKVKVPASNEGPTAHLDYLFSRYREGDLDLRIISPLHYGYLEQLKLVPDLYYEQFPGETIDEKRRQAVIYWLKHQTQTA